MSLATSTQAFQNETKASIKNLEQQMGQLANSVSKLDSQGKLPAQTEQNPNHNVFSITVISPTVVEEEVKEAKEEIVAKPEPMKEDAEKAQTAPARFEVKYKPIPPFPSRLIDTK